MEKDKELRPSHLSPGDHGAFALAFSAYEKAHSIEESAMEMARINDEWRKWAFKNYVATMVGERKTLAPDCKALNGAVLFGLDFGVEIQNTTSPEGIVTETTITMPRDSGVEVDYDAGEV